MIALGIDPGTKAGAIVMLDTERTPAVVTSACAWSRAKRKSGDVMRVWEHGFGAWDEAADFDPIATFFSGSAIRVTIAAVEGHPARMGDRSHGMSLDHVREVGRVVGWVQASTSLSPATPEPAVWRAAIFGIKRGTDAKTCDAEIRRLLPALVTLPPHVPAWALKHLPDACGVALYAAKVSP